MCNLLVPQCALTVAPSIHRIVPAKTGIQSETETKSETERPPPCPDPSTRSPDHPITRLSSALTLLLICCSSLLQTPAQAQTCPFDDGNSSLAVEGLILARYALGVTGAPLVASTGINAADAPAIEATINCPSCGLNITGNPAMTVADVTIISRRLAGFSGAALTDNLELGSGSRNNPAAVQSFLLSGCGATGGLQRR